MKHPTLAPFHFKHSSNDQGKLSWSTSVENTDASLPPIPDAYGPPKTLWCFIFMKLLIKIGVWNSCTSISFFVPPTLPTKRYKNPQTNFDGHPAGNLLDDWIYFWKVGKHFEKQRKSLFLAFCPFSAMLSKTFFLVVTKNLDSIVKYYHCYFKWIKMLMICHIHFLVTSNRTPSKKVTKKRRAQSAPTAKSGHELWMNAVKNRLTGLQFFA